MPKRSNLSSPGKLTWRWRAVYVAAAVMPCLCIVSLAYLNLHASLADCRMAQTMRANGRLMIEVSNLTRELQLERDLTAMLAGSKKNPDLAKSLAQQQAHTDTEVAEDFLKALDSRVIDPVAREAVRRALTEIPRIRTDSEVNLPPVPATFHEG